MESYRDEEIMRKREELKKKKYNNLENGYYVAGKIIRFCEEELLESFYINLPDNMGIMPEDLARIKYPSEFRPQIILTTVNLSVNMGFNLLRRQAAKGEMEEVVKRMEAAIERDHPDYRFYGHQKMVGLEGYWFAFRSHAMDSDLYNMMLAAVLDENTVLVNFNCPYKDYKNWEQVVLLMWKTIRPVGRKGDVIR